MRLGEFSGGPPTSGWQQLDSALHTESNETPWGEETVEIKFVGTKKSKWQVIFYKGHNHLESRKHDGAEQFSWNLTQPITLSRGRRKLIYNTLRAATLSDRTGASSLMCRAENSLWSFPEAADGECFFSASAGSIAGMIMQTTAERKRD